MRTVQDRMLWILEHKEMTRTELAEKAGVARSYVTHLAAGTRGARLSQDKAEKIATAAGVSWEWLMKGGDDPYGGPHDRYPARSEFLAMLGSRADPHVVAALMEHRAPGKSGEDLEYWANYYIRALDVAKAIDSNPRIGPGNLRLLPPAEHDKR